MAAALNGISTHILDTSLGRPAAGVAVVLEKKTGDSWTSLARDATDIDGRVRQMLPDSVPLEAGAYRLTFATGDYFRAQGIEGLYPEVQITFTVRESRGHYHIPLLLTANGYSTYRGS